MRTVHVAACLVLVSCAGENPQVELSPQETAAVSAHYREQLRSHIAKVEETVALAGAAAQAPDVLDQYDAFRMGYDLLRQAQRIIHAVPPGLRQGIPPWRTGTGER